MVKTYLGYDLEASEHFKKSILYFENQLRYEKNGDALYNYKKAYFNTLRQLAINYRHQNKWSIADSLIKKGFAETDADDFRLEHAYFQKSRGILDFEKKNYNDGIYHLEKALPTIQQKNDFSSVAVIYYYLGKTFWVNDNKEKALANFVKIDSIFKEHQFILPEVREAYELMIQFYDEKKEFKKQLFYTKQLLAVDNLLQKDFTYLSSKIHRDYDQKKMMGEKNELEKLNRKGFKMLLFFISLFLIVTGILFVNRAKKKEVVEKYRALQQKFEEDKLENRKEIEDKKRKLLPTETWNEISVKVKKFEDKEEFKLKGLTLHDMAKKLGTNSKYPSLYINEAKGMGFTRYLIELRIAYIIKLLNENNKYINYTITALGEEVGFQHRQKFSDAFLEITGIRPTDFIKQKKRETISPP